jgi:DNA primase
MRGDTEEIKERLSIVDVVSPYVKLQKAGKSLKGLSPFTKEKTPSFFVSPDRGTYYCFSTNQGGDIFTFIEKMEGVDFLGALKILADKAGVELKKESKGDRDSREEVFEALAFGEQFFCSQLLENEEARLYARGRGIEEETIRGWRIGYARDEWRLCMEAALKKGIRKEALLEAGLIKEADGKPGTFYDRFRGRLMFPIRDTAGRTVGFTGRALKSDGETAKYLNSPETSVFKKSSILYGFDRARESIRTRGYVIVVEGQIDLVLAHQAGFTNTVALSGTAFSEVQLALIQRATKNLMLSLDQDRAGLLSLRSIATQGFLASMDVKVVPLSSGKDPADIILAEGKGAFAATIQRALPVVDFLTLLLLKEEKDKRRLLARTEEEVLPIVRAMKSPLMKEHALHTLSQRLGVSFGALEKALQQGDSRSGEVSAGQKEEKAVSRNPLVFLAALVEAFPESDAAGRIMSVCEKANILFPEEVPEDVLFEVERTYESPPSDEEGKILAERIAREHIRGILASISSDIARAEAVGDSVRAEELSTQTIALTESLKALSQESYS